MHNNWILKPPRERIEFATCNLRDLIDTTYFTIDIYLKTTPVAARYDNVRNKNLILFFFFFFVRKIILYYYVLPIVDELFFP